MTGAARRRNAWSNAASYRYMRFRFNSASAGLGVDPNPPDAHVAKYGLCLHKPDAVQFGTGVETLAVKVLLPEDDAPVDRTHVLPVLTVPDALAGTLEGRLSVVKNFRNATAEVASAPAPDLAGFTTFTATLSPSGLVILVK